LAQVERLPEHAPERAPELGLRSAPKPPFPSRLEWFEQVGSTNDVVAGWLRDGVPEVCVAAAEEQTAGRGRNGRTWNAPRGAALLCSLGFRPPWLEPERPWRLAAIVSLAMADAAEHIAGLAPGAIRLKWPNDLVIATDPAGAVVSDPAALETSEDLVVRKLAGVLGETDGLGTDDARAVVGIGVNAGWNRADFPPELEASMTSLLDVSGGRPIDARALLDAFLARLEPAVNVLRAGRFDVAAWTSRQLTNGRLVRLERPDGTGEIVRALGVDGASGALVVAEPGADGVAGADGGERHVLVGEIRHLRVGGLV
jgi:BirA family transcriptional regulator, biotin operon repressor / biotin---[acetyl-CoA-carboxylase] ligase